MTPGVPSLFELDTSFDRVGDSPMFLDVMQGGDTIFQSLGPGFTLEW